MKKFILIIKYKRTKILIRLNLKNPVSYVTTSNIQLQEFCIKFYWKKKNKQKPLIEGIHGIEP